MNLQWLAKLSWPALKHQAGRQLLALLAIALGVALGYAVQLLNTTALAEFGSAAASLNGRPDLVLRARSGEAFDEKLYAQAAQLPGVALAAPAVEGVAMARDAKGERFLLRVIGWDALQAGPLSPELLPTRPTSPLGLLDPMQLSLNAAARARFQGQAVPLVNLRAASDESGTARSLSLHLGPDNAAAGGPRAVLDIAAAQVLLDKLGRIDRIDLKLAAGQDPQRWLRETALPAGLADLAAAPPPDENAKLAELTRAYRVNLGVLSLMAMFTGSFLVFAVMSLSVAQRLPQLALLGVLGMTARERMRLVLAEGLLLGIVGSAAGLLLGWQLAALGLRLLGADLGQNGTTGLHASLRFGLDQLPLALLFAALGLGVSLASALAPALAVRRMPVAQVLKGLGSQASELPPWIGPVLLAAGTGLALLPPLADDVPLAAYASMLALLLGGIACVPMLLRLAVSMLGRHAPLQLLARERSRDQAGEAARALAGVLVALSLSVAMVVMIGSFRDSLERWLTQMLPADVYIRSSLRVSLTQGAPLPARTLQALEGADDLVRRMTLQRSGSIVVDGSAEPVTMLAREIDEAGLPAASPLLDGPGLPVYANEALRDALKLTPGQALTLRLKPDGPPITAHLRAVWRDYARQSPALLLSLAGWRASGGDARITEAYLWLPEGLAPAEAIARLKKRLPGAADLDFAAAADLRGISLRIFDRSFAVTHWLQAVALAIGLFGIAASQSAQVMARRREFGLLLHLGFTRAGVLRLLALEAALACGVGALAGLALGLALSAVLVFVVNPQSFHWSMDMSLPWPRLIALLAAMFAAGVLAALAAGHKAATADAVQAVKEDW
ncbi:FtsX-like permease family protein [Pelomonas sp. KK5]|uniref:ABC transporter permease n=1 Tax=Pelomonas sp. KK5 TaxID=1855730 RepID=UPI00097CB443|nr:FtsX-like permease family protein [Pelomonas sp. KK5]